MANKTSVKRMIWIDERILEERKTIMGEEKHWYLWIMATSPEKARQGFGGLALRYLIEKAEADKIPIYLQTSSASASATDFYLAHGFKICSSISIENQFSVTTMAYR